MSLGEREQIPESGAPPVVRDSSELRLAEQQVEWTAGKLRVTQGRPPGSSSTGARDVPLRCRR